MTTMMMMMTTTMALVVKDRQHQSLSAAVVWRKRYRSQVCVKDYTIDCFAISTN